MLDLVPLACTGRVVADRDGNLQSVRQPLKLHLPEAQTIAVTPAAIRADEKTPRLRVRLVPEHPPPSSNALHRKLRRVMGDAHVHECFVAGHVVTAIGDGLAVRGRREIMNEHWIGSTAHPPSPA